MFGLRLEYDASVVASGREAPADVFAWVGATVDGKYRVEQVVGEGGFGIVYKATHVTMRRPVAVKCLKVGALLTGAARDAFLESFLKEGQLLYDLSRGSAGIVQALDTGAAISPSGLWSPYLVLQWLDGKTLADDLAVRARSGLGGRSLREAVELLSPAALALAFAHTQHVAHRDLKPANLFLTEIAGGVTLKVLDFGVAKVMNTAASTLSAATTSGTPRAFSPAYAAPEQFQPLLGATGPWTDVYALALVLIEVVAGRRVSESRTTEELQRQALDPERRPSLSVCGVAVEDAVARVLDRAVAVDPKNRFKTSGEFWRTLTNVVTASGGLARADLPTLETPEAAKPSATTSPITLLPDRSSPKGERPPARLRIAVLERGRWVTATLFSLLGGAAAVVFFVAREEVRGGDQPRSSVSTLSKDSPTDGMVVVPAGEYVLGSRSADPKRCEAQRIVYSAKRPFLIDRTEVTLAEYLGCIRAGVCTSTRAHAEEQAPWRGLEWCNELRAARGDKVNDNPANCVDRSQAEAFCKWKGKRLPTDDEWEQAARGPGGNEYPWGGEEPSCDRAVFGRQQPPLCPGRGTAPVGSLPHGASSFGILDMSGNVWEWTSTYCRAAGPDRIGTLRGGGFEWSPEQLRPWHRLPWRPDQGGVSTGFRCAMDN